MRGPTVVSYGELGVDNIIRVPYLPSPEQAAFPQEDRYQVGGAAANAAVWLAGWGVRVALSGNLVGDDEMGRQLLAWLAELPALDSSWIRVDPQIGTPFCRIMVTPDGERTILVYGYPDTPVVEASEELLRGARYLTLDLYGGEERLRAAEKARALGVTTVVNEVIDLNHPIVELADIAVNSAAYMRSVEAAAEPHELAHQLQQVSGGAVVTTDGAGPIQVLDRRGNEAWIEPPQVEAVDATGAGDAFRAGLIYGLLQGMDLLQAARSGAAAGALKVAGARAPDTLPSAAEVQRLAQQALVVSAPPEAPGR